MPSFLSSFLHTHLRLRDRRRPRPLAPLGHGREGEGEGEVQSGINPMPSGKPPESGGRRLPNGAPWGEPWKAPRCSARCRDGRACRQPAIKGRPTCRMHGGKGGAPKGARNGRWKHGFCTQEAIDVLRNLRTARQRLIVARQLLDSARHAEDAAAALARVPNWLHVPSPLAGEGQGGGSRGETSMRAAGATPLPREIITLTEHDR
jgi:hypothetical protein